MLSTSYLPKFRDPKLPYVWSSRAPRSHGRCRPKTCILSCRPVAVRATPMSKATLLRGRCSPYVATGTLETKLESGAHGHLEACCSDVCLPRIRMQKLRGRLLKHCFRRQTTGLTSAVCRGRSGIRNDTGTRVQFRRNTIHAPSTLTPPTIGPPYWSAASLLVSESLDSTSGMMTGMGSSSALRACVRGRCVFWISLRSPICARESSRAGAAGAGAGV